jgi:hypothetical protein
MTNAITPRQQRAWDAIHEHRSYSAAAQALGVETSNVREAVRTYMQKSGIPGPPPFVGTYTRRPGVCPEHDATITRLTAQVARLTAALEDAERRAAPWVGVHARLERIEAAVSRPTVVSHRRVADGGRTVRDQRRAA